MLTWATTPPTPREVSITALRSLEEALVGKLEMAEGFIFGRINASLPPRLISLFLPLGLLKTIPWYPLSLIQILSGGRSTL